MTNRQVAGLMVVAIVGLTIAGELSMPASAHAASSGSDPADDPRGQRSRERVNDGRQRDNLEDETVVGADPPEPEEPGLFTGIPIGGAIAGLLLASIIGAAGGLIYAGIMGYRR